MRLRFLSAHKNYTHIFHIREVQSYVYNEHTWHHPPVTLKGRESQKFILATKSSSRSIFISASITRNLLCNFSQFQENTSCFCTDLLGTENKEKIFPPLTWCLRWWRVPRWSPAPAPSLAESGHHTSQSWSTSWSSSSSSSSSSSLYHNPIIAAALSSS